MKYFSFFFGVIILAVIVYFGNYFYNQTYEETMLEIQKNPPLSIPTVPPFITVATESAETASSSGVPKEWKTFISSQYGYTIRFPKDMQNETRVEGDRYFYLGPTQSLGTEMYDGISLLIKSAQINGKTIQQIAKEQHAKYEKSETTSKITPIKLVTFGDHKGYQFSSVSLGESDFIYIPQSDETYLEIINLVASPDKNNSLYQDNVDKIISTISYP